MAGFVNICCIYEHSFKKKTIIYIFSFIFFFKLLKMKIIFVLMNVCAFISIANAHDYINDPPNRILYAGTPFDFPEQKSFY